MIALLLASVLALQDGEVDRIQLRFEQQRQKVRTEAEFRQLLADARAELERFLKANPTHRDAPRASYQIAETWLSAQHPDQALEQFQSLLRDYPAAPDAVSARFALGEIQLEKENDAAARAAFEAFAKLHPQDERAAFARLYVAVTLQNEAKYDEAAAILDAARAEFRGKKESWGAIMQLAVLRHVQEKNADARRLLEELVRDCPDREPVEIARRHLSLYLKVGQDAPGFSVKDVDGRDSSLERLRGKVVLIYFFDPTVQSSIPEAGFVRRVREDAAKAGRADEFQAIGVSIGLERKDITRFRADAKADWTLFFDGKGVDGAFARLYDVRGLPAMTLIDRKGKMRFVNLAGRDLRNCAAKLLEEK